MHCNQFTAEGEGEFTGAEEGEFTVDAERVSLHPPALTMHQTAARHEIFFFFLQNPAIPSSKGLRA